jgi:hypothetical protein
LDPAGIRSFPESTIGAARVELFLHETLMNRAVVTLCGTIALALCVHAQEAPPQANYSGRDSGQTAAARIFVSDVNSRTVPATAQLSSRSRRVIADAADDPSRWGSYRSYASKGYSQMPELAKAFVAKCPSLAIVTVDEEKADYMLIVNHEKDKKPLRHNKTVLVNRDGDVVWGDSTYKLDSAVKDACDFFESERASGK